MEASTSNTLFSDHIIKALCSTLMHSLWQGILLALVAGAIIVFTKKASAAYRYNLLTGAMALFAAGVLFTFMWQLRSTRAGITVIGTTAGNRAAAMSVTNTAGAVPVSIQGFAVSGQPEVKASVTDMVTGYFNAHYRLSF